MKIRQRTGHKAIVAALTAAALSLAATAVVLPGANAAPAPALAPAVLAMTAPSGTVPLTPAGAPKTIPGLASWTAAAGQFTLGTEARVVGANGVLTEGLAQQLATVLGRTVSTSASAALPGDLEIAIDGSRSSELGAEGYELRVGDTIKVTGATDTGAFYGAQTILQLMVQGNQVNKGTSIDVPEYEERGVGLCACQMTISMESLERTMKDMAYNKMNQLWLETKLKSDAYPNVNFWSYYTKDEAAQITEWANKYHIQLVLEVNSPGHMSPWLYNYPELQLVNKNGVKKPEQLDISKPEALEMIKTLADEYAAAFPDQPYWHMGGDEYMMGDSYSNYPQFAAFVAEHPEIFPEGSGPGDVFVWFMNQVNDYVKSTGKQLRIWNDGLPASSVLQLDKDIVVEYWYKGNSLSAQDVLNAGHDVENSSQTFYFSRPGIYSRNLTTLWDTGWTPQTMDGGAVVVDVPGKGKVLGAKLSAWPDDAPLATESQVEEQIYASMRFLAQATWGGPKPTADYAAFSTLSTNLGRVPGYNSYDRTPIGDGQYSVSIAGKGVNPSSAGVELSADGGQKWQFTATDDNYYKISTTDGKCLVMAGGKLWLNAPVDQDLAPSLADCATTSVSTQNLQKWEILKVDGGYTVRNAITQMPLSINAQGALTQQAPDVVAASVFTLAGDVSTSVQAPARAVAGQATTFTVTVDNRTSIPIANATVTPTPPAGWTLTPKTATIGDVAAGATLTATFTATPTASAGYGNFTISAVTSYTADGEALTSTSSGAGLLTCSAAAVTPVDAAVDSFNNGGGEVTPARNAIDGKSDTFWGTAWTPSDAPLPHAITAYLEKELSICAVTVLPRQGTTSGAANGRIKGYEIYVSSTVPIIKDVATYGVKVAEGTFPNVATLQRVFFDAPVVGRYVTLRALSEQNGHAWTTLAELTVDAIDPALIPTEPTATATATETTTETATPTPSETATATATATATESVTSDPSDGATATATATESVTSDPSDGATATATATESVTSDPSDGATATATATESVTSTTSATASATASESATVSAPATSDPTEGATTAAPTSSETSTAAPTTAVPTVDPTSYPTEGATTAPTTDPTTPSTTVSPGPETSGATTSGASAEASVTAPDVVQGQALTFIGGGFAAGEKVHGTVHSDPVDLGVEVADAEGHVAFTWHVPADFQLGEHTVTLTGESSGRSVQAAFTVLATNQNGGATSTATGTAVSTIAVTDTAGATESAASHGGDLANTGANTAALWAGALVMALLGAGIILANRRRAGLHK